MTDCREDDESRVAMATARPAGVPLVGRKNYTGLPAYRQPTRHIIYGIVFLSFFRSAFCEIRRYLYFVTHLRPRPPPPPVQIETTIGSFTALGL